MHIYYFYFLMTCFLLNLSFTNFSMAAEKDLNFANQRIEILSLHSGEEGGEAANIATSVQFNIFEQMFSHLHNKLVHFPIAFLVLAFILSLAQLKWDKFLFTIKILILFGFIFAIPTLITGLFQEEAAEKLGKENFVEIHETFAIITTVISIIWFYFINKENLRKYHLILGILTFILILVTGFLGGILAH